MSRPPLPPPAGPVRQLIRGFTARCPRCGSRGLFRHWFRMTPTCPRCGLHFEREEGYWTGALAMNFVLTGALFAVVFITLVAVTAPSVPVGTLLAVLVPITVLGPILGYPVSKTLWVAVDRALLERLDRA
jgi:uncharacterized protein (DUF983 family)